MTLGELEPTGNRDWLPPSEYLDALARDVLPRYREVRDVLFPRMMTAWELSRSLSAVTLELGGRAPPVRIWSRGATDPPPSVPYALLRGESPETEEIDPNTDLGRFPGPLGGRHRGLQDVFWESVVRVLKKGRVLDVEGAPGLPLLLDGTVRTLEVWVTQLDEDQHHYRVWHPPSYPWSDPDDPRWGDDPELPIAERVKAILEHHRSSSASWLEPFPLPPMNVEAVKGEIRRKIEDPVVREVARKVYVDPLPELGGKPVVGFRLVRALMIIRTYRHDEKRRQLRDERQTVRELGESLFRRPMSPEDRWHMENAMTRWLDRLFYSDRWREEAESALTAEGVEISGSWKDAVIPARGSPGLFGLVAPLIYESIYELRTKPDNRLPRLEHRKSLHEATVQQTGAVLSIAYPPEDLGTGWKRKLRRTLKDKLHP